MGINYLLGRLLSQLGYTVQRSYRYPRCTLNLVDLAYLALLGSGQRELNVVQIGAFDGVASDPLRRILEMDERVRALLVEPQPVAFERLKAKYTDAGHIALENVAICAHDGETVLYVPSGDGASPEASLDPNHRLRFGGRNREVQPITVSAMTMKSLLEKHAFSRIEILQIDTEGYDYQLLTQVFGLSIFPAVINLESAHLLRSEREALRRTFERLHYAFVDAGRDTLAVLFEKFGLEKAAASV